MWKRALAVSLGLWVGQVAFAKLRLGVSEEKLLEQAPPPQTYSHGKYMLGIGASQPLSLDTKYLSKLYGSPGISPRLDVEWTFLRSRLSLGLKLSLSSYTFKGAAAQKSGLGEDPDPEQLVKDEESSTEFTMIPILVGLSSRFSPTASKSVVFQVWAGIQETYWSEMRLDSDSSTTSTTSTTSTSSTSGDDAAEENQVYFASGWSAGYAAGLGVHFDLTGVNRRNIQSLGRVTDFRKMYFTVYYEYVSNASSDKTPLFQSKASSLNVGASVVGLAVTFETR